MNLDISQILIQIIAFLVMLWVLKKFGWKPLLSLLDERRQKIQSEFESIDAQKEDIKKLVDEYRGKLNEIDVEARHKIQEAVVQGQKIAAEIQEQAQTNAKVLISKARAEVDKQLIKVKGELKNEMVNMTIAVAEKILREKLDDSKDKKLITEFVEEAKFK